MILTTRIEKGIPLPPKSARANRFNKNTKAMGDWRKLIMAMDIGDSFLVIKKSIAVYAQTLAKDSFRRIEIRRVMLDAATKTKGWRCWRIQ